MRIKTLFIAPYQGLVEVISALEDKLLDFDVAVVRGDLLEVLPQIQDCEEQGFELIISRGGTARLIREHTSLPVVEIQVSGYDIMRMLTLVEGYKVPIEMIGFPNIIESAVAVANLMNIKVPYQMVQNQDEVETAILAAKQRGVMVVVGDTITVNRATEAGLQGVLITSGHESVLEAFSRARQIYKHTMHYKNSYLLYKNIVNQLEQGVVLFDPSGHIIEANQAFYAYVKDSSFIGQERSQLETYLTHFLRLLFNGPKLEDIIVSFGKGKVFMISGEAVQFNGAPMYYVLLRPESNERSDITLAYSNGFIESFPQFITSNNDFLEQLNDIDPHKELLSPIALYGEAGAGKRLLAGALYKEQPFILEINIIHHTENAEHILFDLLEKVDTETVIYVKHIERLDIETQRNLAKMLADKKGRIIFAFATNPFDLNEKGLLNSRLYKLFKDRVFRVPSVKERQDSIEAYIRTFIVKYNELFGKQIVGIKQDVLDKLLAHPWQGNLIEMRDTIKAFVKHTSGPFIDVDVLKWMGNQAESETPLQENQVINLNQSLEHIERDIIQKVLEEEGMNQTKAAERLGINRSTLWRKLKNNE